MKAIILFIIPLLFVSCGNKGENTSREKSNEYIVNQLKEQKIIIDGKLDESDWGKANSITDFTLPWENLKSQPAEFKALYDSNNFYYSFSVKDTETVVLDSIETEEDLVYEDRVEIYFAFDDKLAKPYYCAEVDSKGRILDYQATFPRQFDFDVDWGAIKAAAVNNDSGYTVEAAISLNEMKKLGYKIDGDKTQLKVAVFRADFEKSANDTLIKHWQAWINPNVSKPDFHVPSSFSDFIFGK